MGVVRVRGVLHSGEVSETHAARLRFAERVTIGPGIASVAVVRKIWWKRTLL